MSLAQKGRKPKEYTEEQQVEISRKILNAHKGKPKSDEHKSKMRKPKFPEHIKAILDAKAKKKLLLLS